MKYAEFLTSITLKSASCCGRWFNTMFNSGMLESVKAALKVAELQLEANILKPVGTALNEYQKGSLHINASLGRRS